MVNEGIKEKQKNLIIIMAMLFFFGVLYRFTNHPSNFTPVAAISLFAGRYFKKYWVISLPILILLFSDFFIGFYDLRIMAAVYLSFALIGLIGIFINKKHYFLKIILGSLDGSFLFFIITNFAVWCFGNWYTKDLYGLTQCYYMAIPFFRNTLVGDLFFNGLIFGCYELYCSGIARIFSKARVLVN